MALQIPQEVYFQWMLQLVDIEYLSAFIHLLQTHLYMSAVLAKAIRCWVFWATIEFS